MSTTAQITAVEAYATMASELEAITNTAPQSLAGIEPGEQWIQGDVRICRLPDNAIETLGDRIVPVQIERQLAPGATQGSRHLLASTEGVQMWRFTTQTPLDGVLAVLAVPNAVMHPEHGDCIGIPAGVYCFPGQRSVAEELRRVAD